MRLRHARPELDGWRAMRARSDDGAFESDERVRVTGPVVEFSEHGARVLAMRVRAGVARPLVEGLRNPLSCATIASVSCCRGR